MHVDRRQSVQNAQRRIRSFNSHLTGSATGSVPQLTLESVNPVLVKAEYAVRGAVLNRAMEIDKALAAGESFPFKKTISCNIGNPHSLGQEPVSFLRQVLALVISPSLIDNPPPGFEADVVARARAYHSALPGSGMGAYSNSQGTALVRQEVAEFINQRDGMQGEYASPEKIFLTDGASSGVKNLMVALIRGGSEYSDGVMVPIPQYPLYSALSTLAEGVFVPYYLDESAGWETQVEELKRSIKEGRNGGKTTVRAIVVINPGNPTGQVMSIEGMESVVKFCVEENIVLLADEVYQENIWNPKKEFISFKKVAHGAGFGEGSVTPLQLVSFHSTSKGFLGECGLRGGYFELHGMPADVAAQLYKLASISLCSNTVGQIATGLMVNPPAVGSPSFAKYAKERDTILDSLQRRADRLTDKLNAMEGVHCQPVEGALYAFPSIALSAKAAKAAAAVDQTPDSYYCLQALEATGIVIVPGAGFKQKEGTLHFRTTFLPAEDEMEDALERLGEFHRQFFNTYR